MNERTGEKVYDVSGNNWNATIANFPGNQDWSLSEYGPSILGDNTNTNKIQLNLIKDIGTVHSFVAWIRLIDTAEEHLLFGGVAWNDGGYLWWGDYVSPNVYNVYYSADGSSKGLQLTLTAATWYQVGISRNGTTVRWYVDGVQMGTDTLAANNSMDKMKYIIGLDTNSTAYNLDGDIDHAILWDVVLTDEEFARLYREQFPWFKDDILDVYAPPAAAPAGGQVIIINLSSMGYGLSGFFLVFIWGKLRKDFK
jgi:hypothetical protein